MRRRLLLLLHAVTQLSYSSVALSIDPSWIYDNSNGNIEDHCKQSFLAWLQSAGVTSFLQPLSRDVESCLSPSRSVNQVDDNPQYCYIKRRIPVPLPVGDTSSDATTTTSNEANVLLASITAGACLPSSCSADHVAQILDDMCSVHSCVSLPTQAEVQLCTLTQALHCDPVARLSPSATSHRNIYLHCATDNPTISHHVIPSNSSNNYVSMTPLEAKALAACGTSNLRDWRLLYQSGGLQDLGDFDSCTAPGAGSSYCLVEYYGVLASGRCVPNECTEPLMQVFFDYMCRRVGKDGMAQGIDSTCLDYANVIPLDLCITAQLLGCGRSFKLADMSSGEMDISILVRQLFRPQRASEKSVLSSRHKSMEFLGSMMDDLEDVVKQISGPVSSVMDLKYGRKLLGQEDTALSYSLSCDLKPVPKEGKDWIMTWLLFGSFFMIFPLLGLLAYHPEGGDELFMAGSTPTPISNQPVSVPSLPLWHRLRMAIGMLPRLNSFLTCFSVSNNTNKATQQRRRIQSGPFPHLDGLRSLSIVWIVVGHAFIFGMRPGVLHNLGGLSRIWDSFTFQAVYSAQFAVDTFFLIGGMMLGAHGPRKLASMLRSDPRRSSATPSTLNLIKAWGMLVVQRFVRITGLYYFVMAVSYYSLQFCGFSPKWPSLLRLLRTGEAGGCQKYWWSLVLLVNNLYPDEALTECFGHAWFLANDFQFFLIGAVLIILICYRERWFRVLWWTILAGSLACTWHTIMTYNIRLPATLMSGMTATVVDGHKSLAAGLLASLTKFYSKPWCRIPPYLIGIYYGKLYSSGDIADILGVSVASKDGAGTGGAANSSVEQYVQLGSPQSISMSIKSSRGEKGGDAVFTAITNLVAIATLTFLIFIPYEANKADAPEWNRLFDASYMAFSRTVWAVALGWLICSMSYSNPDLSKKDGTVSYIKDPFTSVIFAFLRQPVFSYIGLVSYALYLIHLPIQEVYYASLRQAIAMAEGSGWFYGISFSGVSLIAAGLLYLFVEIPLSNLAKLIGL